MRLDSQLYCAASAVLANVQSVSSAQDNAGHSSNNFECCLQTLQAVTLRNVWSVEHIPYLSHWATTLGFELQLALSDCMMT